MSHRLLSPSVSKTEFGMIFLPSPPHPVYPTLIKGTNIWQNAQAKNPQSSSFIFFSPTLHGVYQKKKFSVPLLISVANLMISMISDTVNGITSCPVYCNYLPTSLPALTLVLYHIFSAPWPDSLSSKSGNQVMSCLLWNLPNAWNETQTNGPCLWDLTSAPLSQPICHSSVPLTLPFSYTHLLVPLTLGARSYIKTCLLLFLKCPSSILTMAFPPLHLVSVQRFSFQRGLSWPQYPI